jgi:hypothetical protein
MYERLDAPTAALIRISVFLDYPEEVDKQAAQKTLEPASQRVVVL